MNLTEPFIRRPVATTLLTAGITLAGAAAFGLLPVAPLPQVDFPTISVQAQLPGASPEVMAATVATPLERALGRIAGVTEMTSSSSLGNARITLQFDLNRDIDGAARDVQAAINAARSQLPTSLPRNPTYRKVNPADAPIMILALTSDTMDRGQLYDAASTILAQRISQVSGVGQVTVGGASLPAVRVELNPTALNSYGIALDDVRAALAAANANRPKGSVEDGDRHWQIQANDQAKKASEYIPLIVAFRNGAAVRLSDVAEVVDGVEDLRNAGSSNGRPSVLLIINRQPNANIIETVERVRDIMPLLRASIPRAINLDVVLERTSTIRASLREVERTLLVAMALVILVVFAFLRSARATLIPAVAVPVSLITTFGVMYLCGFSLNNLSLMALTIATGFVVDDAIVVLENVSRHIERGLTPFQAALLGAKEVSFTVLSMSVSLIAVFIPILLMGGIVGRLFREFAVTLSVAILVSLAVSLTMTPMMCARLLKAPGERRAGRLFAASERVFSWMLAEYEASLGWALRHPRLMMLLLAATIGLNVYLYIVIPKGFFPQQDTGRMIGSIQADQGISFQAMRQKLSDFIEIVKSDPAVENVVGFTGGGQRNSGFMFMSLKPLKERKVSADQVVARLRPRLAQEAGASLFLVPVQDIRIGGRQANAQYQFTLQADELPDLRTWEPRVRQALSQLPELADVNTDQQDKGLETMVTIDRLTAARMGLTPKMIDTTLYNAFGQAQVSTIYQALNQYHVVMEVAPQYWQSPEALNGVYVLSPTKGQVPLTAIARYEPSTAPLAVNHQGQFVASTISFNLPPGVTLGQATTAINDAMARIGVPTTVHGSFQGTARAFQASLDSQPWLVLTALIAVYIVLGILYESTIHPITILSTLPSAGVGALLALIAFRTEFSIIALIGVILLIGIVKKNAIMMIDFAIEAERREGKRPEEAIFQACLLRFRPIMMTTMAALLGAVPLAIGFGDGSEFRRPLGIAIVGGLIVSQLLTLYTTPVVYLYFDRFRIWLRRVLGVLGLVALAGCAVGPDYERPSVEVPEQYREWKVAQPQDDASRGPWWEMFGDPALSALVEQVQVSNQTVLAAEAQYRRAQAIVAASRSGLFPTVNANASAARSRSPVGVIGGTTAGRTITNRTASLDASWELDLWGRIRRTAESSEASAQASAADIASARLSSQATLASSYLLLRTIDEQKRILDESVAAFQKSFELTKNRYDAGVAAKVDVVQAQTQLKSTMADAIDLGVQRAQLEHAIAVLVGKAPSSFSIPVAPLAFKMPAVPSAVPSALLERRPDIASAERLVASANAQIGIAKAAYFPSLTLSGSYGSRAGDAATWFTAPSTFWSYGPALAMSVFDAGLRRAQTDQAVAAYDATVAQYRQTVLSGFQEVEDNLAALRILEEEAKVQREAVLAARESVILTTNQYKAGIVSFINVVAVQTAWLNNERAAMVVLGRRLVAAVTLLKALGGGWSTAEIPEGEALRTRSTAEAAR